MTRPPKGIEGKLSWLALFTTTGTLVCCALPIALVTLGMGSAVAALTSSLPFLITLSQHKTWVFAISGLLLATGWWATHRNRQCPTDPALRAACEQAARWNRRILALAIAVWTIGFMAAYLALPIARWLEG
ncbi:hypothetical protein [Thiohalobacter sp.]|uniref:hypothetical protein n=1 Tax=Thiohalobacter sp. TaxID=2025948 RepID=UPI0026351232|nr:hypothetical protein [Thiohalobacter sp.]